MSQDPSSFQPMDGNRSDGDGDQNNNDDNNAKKSAMPVTQAEEEVSSDEDEDEEYVNQSSNEVNNEDSNNNENIKKSSDKFSQPASAGDDGGGEGDPNNSEGDGDSDDSSEDDEGDEDANVGNVDDEDEKNKDDNNINTSTSEVSMIQVRRSRLKKQQKERKTETEISNRKRTNVTMYTRDGKRHQYVGTATRGRVAGGKATTEGREPFLDRLEQQRQSSTRSNDNSQNGSRLSDVEQESGKEDNDNEDTLDDCEDAVDEETELTIPTSTVPTSEFIPTIEEALQLSNGTQGIMSNVVTFFSNNDFWPRVLEAALLSITDTWSQDRSQAILSQLRPENQAKLKTLWLEMRRKVKTHKKTPQQQKLKKKKRKKKEEDKNDPEVTSAHASSYPGSRAPAIPYHGAQPNQNNGHLFQPVLPPPHYDGSGVFQNHRHMYPPPPNYYGGNVGSYHYPLPQRPHQGQFGGYYQGPQSDQQVISSHQGNILTGVPPQGAPSSTTAAQGTTDSTKPTEPKDRKRKKKASAATSSKKSATIKKEVTKKKNSDGAVSKKKTKKKGVADEKKKMEPMTSNGNEFVDLSVDDDENIEGYVGTLTSRNISKAQSIVSDNLDQGTVYGHGFPWTSDPFKACSQQKILSASVVPQGVKSPDLWSGVNFISQEIVSRRQHFWSVATGGKVLNQEAEDEVRRNANKYTDEESESLPHYADADGGEVGTAFSCNPVKFRQKLNLKAGFDHYDPNGMTAGGELITNPTTPRSCVISMINSKQRGQKCEYHRNGCGNNLVSGSFVFVGGEVQYLGGGVSEILTRAFVPGEGKGCCVGRLRCLTHQVPSFVNRLGTIGYISSNDVLILDSNCPPSEFHKKVVGYAHLIFMDFDNLKFNPFAYRQCICEHLPTEAKLLEKEDVQKGKK